MRASGIPQHMKYQTFSPMFIKRLVSVLSAGVLVSGFVPSLAFAADAVPAFSVAKLVLVNATTQQDIRELVDGGTINLATDGTALNIRADVAGTVGSVSFSLDGSTVRTESGAPFSYAADDQGSYRKWTPPLGTHVFKAQSYQSAGGSGALGGAAQASITVVNTAAVGQTPPTTTTPPPASTTPTAFAVSKLVLINASTQKEVRQLTNGDTINLAVDGSSLNIRADVTGTVGSVTFVLDGAVVRTENGAPFAFAADDSGKYRKWTPTLGAHKIQALSYQSDNRVGTVGGAVEVTVNVINSIVAVPPIPPVVTVPQIVVPAGQVVSRLLYNTDGTLNLSMYAAMANNYDKASMETRLGPAFADLSPNAADDRPTWYQPPSKARSSGYVRTNPYELGGTPVKDGDYWSDSGQVGYIPDDPLDAGLDRIQTYAYYDRVFAISPRLDYASGRPHSDPQTRESYYATLFGQLPKHPIAMVRNYGMQQNEQLVLYKGGYLAVAGTQTSRAGAERPYPGMVFPANKVPTAIAITTANEFALVTVWDTDTKKGQLAVIALEGKYLPFHTWPYMGLPNQGSWSALKLLGYIDLPMSTPTAVSAASNGWWSGPSQTGGLVLSQIKLTDDTLRQNVYSGGWAGVVAKGGYAVVASQYDNKAVVVDLAPLFSYMRESYLSSAASFNATIAARGTGASDFPQAFSVNPAIMPKVVFETNIGTPTAVLAGMRMDRWTRDHYKGYVASRDGTITVIDTSSLMKRSSWETLGALRVAGSFQVGANPVSMCFTRRGEGTLPLLPYASGVQSKPDPLNNIFYVAVRGERKVVAVVTYGGAGAVYRTIKDSRMDDPVAVSTAVRGPILSVTDFRGKKMHSFRVGEINDLRNKVIYYPGTNGTDEFEYTGSIPFAGNPFLVNSTNVN